MEKTPSFRVHAFGDYFLLERIAVGGMAEIFKAKQVGVRGFEKILVIKKILHHLSEDPEFVEMFEDEAKIAAQLTQANIVQIYELGEVDGTLYITMEYIDGKNLRDITRASTGKGIHLTVDQCTWMMAEILKGLDYAHRKVDSSGEPLRIIHRDMSPQNIIVSYEGEVKILDFGIAKAASKISRTEVGVLKGKFSYMSPEQASGKLITQTSDIYACGVILHELLTSDRLFRAKTDMETLERVKEGIVAPPSEKNPDVPPELDAIVIKALKRDTSERYQTASELLQDLSRFNFERHSTYGTQDQSAFMQALFAETIKDEKERLINALSQVPASPTAQLQNARTQIAFKRNPGADDVIEFPSVRGDITLTGQRKTNRESRSKIIILSAASFILLLAAWFYFSSGSKPKPAEPDITISSPLAEPSAQASPTLSAIADDNPKPTLPTFPLPTKSTVGTIFNIEPPTTSEPEPQPTPAEPKPSSLEVFTKIPKKTIKPHSSAKPTPPPKIKANPPAASFGLIDVIAPAEGFAQLSINSRPFGTVPGPTARGIKLPVGKHLVQCQTTLRVYSGKIEVKAGTRINVRCDDLK